jgi:integrase
MSADIFSKKDSIEAKFLKSALVHNRAATLTKVRMLTTFRALAKFAKAGRWGTIDPYNLTAKQLRKYTLARIEQDVCVRSVQNETSHIRRALRGVGRSEFAQKICSNKALGVPPASRIGTGKVVDPIVFQSALLTAPADTHALIELSRWLGLRIREAILSANSLREWDRSLSAGQPILVRYGSKGGRVRSVPIRPEGIEPAQDAVKTALAVVKKQKWLVVSKNLKSAIKQHSYRLERVGLHGENSCHSLRRAFAMDQYRYYLQEGNDQKTALARTSNDLGHGDKRGRWVYNNYLRCSLESGNPPEKEADLKVEFSLT